MNFTSRLNHNGDVDSTGSYQLLSSFDYGTSSKDEEYPYTPIRRKTSRNLLLKSERRRHCSSPNCTLWVSPTTPRSMLPRGTCECALDSLPTLPRDSSANILPQDLYSALKELELGSTTKGEQTLPRRSMRSSRNGADTPPSGPSSPRSRLLNRLKIPSSGRRVGKLERSTSFDLEITPSSSAASSRYGSPLARRSPTPFTPFTPGASESVAAPLYDTHEFNPTLRVESAALDVDVTMAATETAKQDTSEQGTRGAKSQDPLIIRLKLPDSVLGHNSRGYSRLP